MHNLKALRTHIRHFCLNTIINCNHRTQCFYLLRLSFPCWIFDFGNDEKWYAYFSIFLYRNRPCFTYSRNILNYKDFKFAFWFLRWQSRNDDHLSPPTLQFGVGNLISKSIQRWHLEILFITTLICN